MNLISIIDLRAEAEQMTAGLPSGEPLDALDSALIALATAVSVTALDRSRLVEAIGCAFDAGASVAQVQEIIALASGSGCPQSDGESCTRTG